MLRRKQTQTPVQAPTQKQGGINPIFAGILGLYGLAFLAHAVIGNVNVTTFFQSAESEINKIVK